jgi:hypothetical protein
MKTLISDILTSAYISGTFVFGLSFGYHNIQNANLYLRSIHNSESYDRQKRLLHSASIVKGVIFGATWPLSSSLYYLRDNKLPIVCPLYYATDYRKFYDANAKRIQMPN